MPCSLVSTRSPYRCSIAPFHVLMLCRKYKSTLKFCYEKKMGFVKIKKNIFSRTGLTGSLSPQRASRLFALALSRVPVRRCAIPASEPRGAGRRSGGALSAPRRRAADALTQCSPSARTCINVRTPPRHFTRLPVQTLRSPQGLRPELGETMLPPGAPRPARAAPAVCSRVVVAAMLRIAFES